MNDQDRELMAKKIEVETCFDVDLVTISSLLVSQGWSGDRIMEWKRQAWADFDESIDLRLRCPKRALAVWKEKPHMDKRLIVLPAILMMVVNCKAGFILTEENDVFTGTDNYYTQGLELMFPGGLNKSTNGIECTGYGIKNLFYSPRDIGLTTPPAEDDRPWAGYTAIERKDWRWGKGYSRRIDWLVGVAGDWSQSDEIQTSFHRWIRNRKPMGWDNQIPSEPFINVTADYFKPLWIVQNAQHELGMDLTGMCGGSLGTAFINGELGASLRAGWNLPADSWSGIIKPTRVTNRYSIFGVAEQYGRVVAHNLMLGGSLFQDGPSRDLEPLVFDSVLGGSFIARSLFWGLDMGISYRRVWRTDEFEHQQGNTDFGSVTVSFTESF